MEEFWDNTGPYALAKLADRLVPVPRDTEAPVSLYALCRAWVRNNPSLPLSVDAPSPVNRDAKDAVARLGNIAGPSIANGDGGGQPPQQQREPESQPGGLLSILPPVLPPTSLETETAAPTYPLDDFEPQEPEEAQRKLKDHWLAVRQYHQAVVRAKRSRCSERLRVLLGEPSSLQQQQQLLLQQPPTQQLQLQMALQQQQALAGIFGPLQAQALNSVPMQGLPAGFSGALLMAGGTPGPGAPQSQAAGADPRGGGPSASGAGLPANAVNMADAQAALAMLAALEQLPAAVDSSGAQQQGPPPLQVPPPSQQQQGVANAAADAQPPQQVLTNEVAPSLDVLMALQHQQQLTQLPQVAALAQPVQGQSEGMLPSGAPAPHGALGLADGLDTAAGSAVPAGSAPGPGVGSDGPERMDIDGTGPCEGT